MLNKAYKFDIFIYIVFAIAVDFFSYFFGFPIYASAILAICHPRLQASNQVMPILLINGCMHDAWVQCPMGTHAIIMMSIAYVIAYAQRFMQWGFCLVMAVALLLGIAWLSIKAIWIFLIAFCLQLIFARLAISLWV